MLQFDAGRATCNRLAEHGVRPLDVTAVFLTHLHSDHVFGLPELVLTRWIEGQFAKFKPLTIIAPTGGAARFVQKMLDPFDEDIAVRREHTGSPAVTMDAREFTATYTPVVVWSSDDGTVVVRAVAVHHEPVTDAVAYQITTPDGVIVISGDTQVCKEVEDLSRGADVLVSEIFRRAPLEEVIRANPVVNTILDYHSDSIELGGLAERAHVKTLMLTHLGPPPTNERQEQAFSDDVRAGGYTGVVMVGRDLMSITL